MKLLQSFLSTKVVAISIFGAVLLTILSTFFHSEELALTTAGEYTKKQAEQLHLSTNIYYGWPVIMYTYTPAIMYDKNDSLENSLGATVFANLFALILFLFTLIPNLWFWGLISFVLLTVGRIVFYLFRTYFG